MAFAHLNATMDHAKGPEAYANVICIISEKVSKSVAGTPGSGAGFQHIAALGKRTYDSEQHTLWRNAL